MYFYQKKKYRLDQRIIILLTHVNKIETNKPTLEVSNPRNSNQTEERLPVLGCIIEEKHGNGVI